MSTGPTCASPAPPIPKPSKARWRDEVLMVSSDPGREGRFAPERRLRWRRREAVLAVMDGGRSAQSDKTNRASSLRVVSGM